MRLKQVFMTAVAVIAAQGALAIPYNEVGDAGQTLGTAQSLGGNVTRINGFLAEDSADLFQFTWGGGVFGADTRLNGTEFDTQLFLFDSQGRGIRSNDDGFIFIFYTDDAALERTLAAGSYYLGISGFNTEPFGAGGAIFQDNQFGQNTPNDPNRTLTGWSGGGEGGYYHIDLSATATPVPEPATLALLGMGLLGIGFGARRRKA